MNMKFTFTGFGKGFPVKLDLYFYQAIINKYKSIYLLFFD